MIKYVLLFLAIFIIYCTIEHQLFITSKKDIYLKELPKSFDGFRVLQISDLHHRNFGKNHCRITKRAEKLRPDIIVITGDLVSRDQRDFTKTEFFCRTLVSIAPVFFSVGNHELDLPSDVQREYFDTLKRAGVHLLIDETTTLNRNDESLTIAGAALETGVYHDGNHRYGNLNMYSREELEKAIGVRHTCTLLLAHNPLIFDAYADWKADLILSGHVHGGVVRLPFLGGTLSPERRFFPHYTKGLYRKCDSQMYVSAGLGKIRFLNPPEVNLITLRQAK